MIRPITEPTAEPGAEAMPIFAARYAVRTYLKRGQGIDTLLGVDIKRGDEVVIKTATNGSFSKNERVRLEHEAEILQAMGAELGMPLLHLGYENGVLFLVMPFISGLTLQERLARGSLSVDDTLTVGCQVVDLLSKVHDRGILHRDIKPSNVIVDEMTPLQRATLIDFGLARTGRLDKSVRDVPVGTALYMSPEQAGLLHQEVDERSDLYSTGALLFECLAGRPPFTGQTVREVLNLHLTASPPTLRSIGCEVPRALDELVQRLLRKDPRERYQSAEAVRADLSVLADNWKHGITEPALVLGLKDRRRTLTEPAFIGREADLEALGSLFSRARCGQGGVVLLESESGGGKTRLLQEFAQQCSRQGAWILRGQGVDQGAQRPFQVLVGVVGDFLSAAQADDLLSARIGKGLGEQLQAMGDVFPELAEIFETDAAPQLGPEAFGEIRSLRALSSFFDNLGMEAKPALVVLDDCQWADELTLKFLVHWQEHLAEANAHRPPVLVVAAFRSDEVFADHPLRRFQPLSHRTLSPLAGEHVQRLVESMAGTLPPEILPVVERLAEGSPFMGTAVLRGLVETGALVPEAVGWRVNAEALAEVQASRQAAAVLFRRLQVLPPATLRLLLAGAVIGKEFDVQFAAELAEQPLPEALSGSAEARRRHILWPTEEAGQFLFSHDKIREGLLAMLSAEERRNLHLRAALQLETTDLTRVFELAYHYDAAGKPENALPFALAAAEQARAQHSLEVAQKQYLIAARGSSGAAAAIRLRVAEGLGDVLMLRGQYHQAQAEFEKALALADSAVAQAQIEGKVGELAFKRGDMKTASQALERGLRLLGRWVPRHFLSFLAGCLWEILKQLLHSALPKWFLGQRRREGADAEFHAIRLYSRLAYAYWFGHGKVPCAWAHLREMNLVERYPPSLELAQAYSEHAPVMTMVPYFARALAYAEKSLALRRALADIWGQGQSLHFYGVALYAASRYQECIDKCREAVRLMERTGDRWEVNTANWHIAYCLYRLGDLQGAIEISQRVHGAGLEIGDHQASAIGLALWAKASGGRVPAHLIRTELQRPSADVHTRAEILMAEGVRLLREDSPFQAVQVLEEADRQVRAKGLQQEYVAPVLPWLTTALREAAIKTPVWEPAKRKDYLRRAHRASRRGLRLARKYRNNLPHALREKALLAAMANRPKKASRYFAESLAVCLSQGARYEQAQTLKARGDVGLSLGWEGAQADLAAGDQALAMLEASQSSALTAEQAEPPAITLSLVDRFDTLLEAGRRLASALSRQAIFTAVREAALGLLGGEDCLVLDIAGGPGGLQISNQTLGQTGSFSRSMVEQAVAGGRPVVFAEEIVAPPSESIVLSGVQSALVAPIYWRGHPVACFCLTHRQVGGLFDEDEKRLAGFIATLAGAALENAEGFSEIQTLNKALEQRAHDLAEADRHKNDFLALLGHELRNPLAPIRNALCLLREPKADSKVRTWAEDMIGRQVGQLTHLIDDLLDVSRITRGKIELHKEVLDLVPLIERAAESAAPLIQERHHQLSIQLPKEPLPLEADAVRIQQIVVNLLNNAAKYTEPGGLITLSADRDGEQAMIWVRDTGIGIPADLLERIFEPFVQVGRSRASIVQWGLGIGLTLVRSLVELHGGTVAATSPGLDRGSEFIVRLPLLQAGGLLAGDEKSS